MDIDYDDSERARAVAARTRSFIEEEVIPVERDLRGATEIPEDRLERLRERARERDVFGPGVPAEYGGLGLDLREQVPVVEEAGRSVLGIFAIHAPSWPTESGINALEFAGSEQQRERWLGPLARGEAGAAISLTEPPSGAGSDPTMTATTARRDDDEWVIDGHKWWVTGGSTADVVMVYARTDPDGPPHEALTCFLVPKDAEGLTFTRDIAHVSDHVVGEPVHSEMTLDGVRVPDSAVLGDPGDGFSFFQRVINRSRVWLGVRKSGMATRALDVAKAYAEDRQAFGEPLSQKQGLRWEIADAETDLHMVRLMARDVAGKLTAGEQARTEVSMFKYRAANLIQDAVDTAVQACGANGIGEDLPLADFYTNVRAYRIYDGADAVHRSIVARAAFEETDPGHIEGISRFGQPRDWPGE